MDSPFLPLSRRTQFDEQELDPSASLLLADLSLAIPDSPSQPHSDDGCSYLEPHSVVAPLGDTEDDTKYRAKDFNLTRTKPRFSLFAASGTSVTSSSKLPRTGQGLIPSESLKEESITGIDGDNSTPPEYQLDPNINSSNEIQDGNSVDRNERLRLSLIELQQINNVFDDFLNALGAAKDHNQRLARRVEQTSILLDQYVVLLGQAHQTQQLILNSRWIGMTNDVAALAEEKAIQNEALAQAAKEAEVAAEAVRQKEEQRQRQEKEEQRIRDSGIVYRGASQARGGKVRMRGTRGRGSGSGIPARQVRPTASLSSGTISARTGSNNKVVKRSVPESRWANVQSSGYGPRPS